LVQTISILVSGKVQGVFYRQSTREKAQQLGITGTVKNQRDGSVYIIATGAPAQLEQLVAWCRQGPPRAVVTDVQTATIDTQSFTDFDIAR
jgi:acylphosphatase